MAGERCQGPQKVKPYNEELRKISAAARKVNAEEPMDKLGAYGRRAVIRFIADWIDEVAGDIERDRLAHLEAMNWGRAAPEDCPEEETARAEIEDQERRSKE